LTDLKPGSSIQISSQKTFLHTRVCIPSFICCAAPHAIALYILMTVRKTYTSIVFSPTLSASVLYNSSGPITWDSGNGGVWTNALDNIIVEEQEFERKGEGRVENSHNND